MYLKYVDIYIIFIHCPDNGYFLLFPFLFLYIPQKPSGHINAEAINSTPAPAHPYTVFWFVEKSIIAKTIATTKKMAAITINVILRFLVVQPKHPPSPQIAILPFRAIFSYYLAIAIWDRAQLHVPQIPGPVNATPQPWHLSTI